MKWKSDFNGGFKIVTPKPCKLWGSASWPANRKWMTGPTRHWDDPMWKLETLDGESFTLTKIDADGKLLWTRPIPDGSQITHISNDGDESSLYMKEEDGWLPVGGVKPAEFVTKFITHWEPVVAGVGSCYRRIIQLQGKMPDDGGVFYTSPRLEVRSNCIAGGSSAVSVAILRAENTINQYIRIFIEETEWRYPEFSSINNIWRSMLGAALAAESDTSPAGDIFYIFDSD